MFPEELLPRPTTSSALLIFPPSTRCRSVWVPGYLDGSGDILPERNGVNFAERPEDDDPSRVEGVSRPRSRSTPHLDAPRTSVLDHQSLPTEWNAIWRLESFRN